MKRLLKWCKTGRGQIAIPVIIVVGILGVTVMALVPAINLSLESGPWSFRGAKEYLERNGYSVTLPATDLNTDDLLPNTDSTWDIGASGNEFVALESDKLWFGTSEIKRTGSQDVYYNVLGVAPNTITNNEDLSAGLPITFTLLLQPDVPRTISLDFDAHIAITAYTIVITGVDSQGNAVVETFTEAVDPWNFETDAAYATVTSIQMTARTGNGVTDTADVGITDVLGLSNVIGATGDVWKITKNAIDQTIAGAQVNIIAGTYDMAVIGLIGADNFTIWYDGNVSTLD